MPVSGLVGFRHYVVGVDGGATKTVALLGDEHSRIFGRGESGSSNYHNVGIPLAVKAIRGAVRAAQERAGVLGTPEIAVVALAGIDSPRDRVIARRFVRDAKIARESFVVHDSVAALEAATRGKPGIIVISGTGCVAAGINSGGEYRRAGGWGYLAGDEGSGYDIGRKALMAAYRALDGSGQPTGLTNAFKRRFRVGALEDALPEIYSNGMTVDEIARLAPLISRMASKDRVSRQILSNAGIALAELVCAVARRLRMAHVPLTVSTVGGVFKAGRYLTDSFTAKVRNECPFAKIVRPRIEPATGAFSLALREMQRRRRSQPATGLISHIYEGEARARRKSLR